MNDLLEKEVRPTDVLVFLPQHKNSLPELLNSMYGMDQWEGKMSVAQQYWENENVLIVITCKEDLCECSHDRQNPQRFSVRLQVKSWKFAGSVIAHSPGCLARHSGWSWDDGTAGERIHSTSSKVTDRGDRPDFISTPITDPGFNSLLQKAIKYFWRGQSWLLWNV